MGFEVVALNASDTLANIGLVDDFIANLGIEFQCGLEETKSTYQALTANFDGINPFPLDILVDRNGVIRYITREYDADEMQGMIEELLAE